MQKWGRLNKEAMEFYQNGDLEGAEKNFTEAVKDAERYGPEDIRVSECMDNVIWMHHARGKVGQAETMIRKSLTIQERVHGKDNEYISWNLGLLAEICQGQDKFEEAEEYFRRAIAIDERSIGPHAPSVAKYSRQCGEVLRQLHRNLEADTMDDRAKAIEAKQPESESN